MTTVIGVSFKRAGKMYYFDPNGLELHIGDQVVVETARGMECGDVVTEVRQVEEDEVVQPLKPVLRVMTEEDRQRVASNEKKEAEAFVIGQQRIAHHKLEMKLVDVEYTFDLSKIIFYFTANGRIDFRELVKDLASIFKTRIELRQIGVRDEAKMIGGLGSCGRPICCRTFLGDFQPVSIKMAKEQNLLLNPTKISGLCGRLMCCLKYEQSNYEEAYRRVPRVGKEVLTPDGRGTVAEISVVREKVRVRFPGKDGAPEYREYDFDQVQAAPKEAPQAEKPRDEKPREDAPEAPAAAAEDELAPAAAEEAGEAPAQAAPQEPRPPRPPRPRRKPRREGEERPAEGGQPQTGGAAQGGGRGSRPPRPPRSRGGQQGGQQQGAKSGEPRAQGGGDKPAGGEGRKPSRRPPRQGGGNGGRPQPKEQRPAPRREDGPQDAPTRS